MEILLPIEHLKKFRNDSIGKSYLQISGQYSLAAESLCCRVTLHVVGAGYGFGECASVQFLA